MNKLTLPFATCQEINPRTYNGRQLTTTYIIYYAKEIMLKKENKYVVNFQLRTLKDITCYSILIDATNLIPLI